MLKGLSIGAGVSDWPFFFYKSMKLSPKDNIEYTLKELRIPYQKEYKFLTNRKFRFDYYIELAGHRIGIEYDGLISKKSRHTTISGFSADTEKTNLAQMNGYMVLRYTALTFQQLRKDLIWLTPCPPSTQ